MRLGRADGTTWELSIAKTGCLDQWRGWGVHSSKETDLGLWMLPSTIQHHFYFAWIQLQLAVLHLWTAIIEALDNLVVMIWTLVMKLCVICMLQACKSMFTYWLQEWTRSKMRRCSFLPLTAVCITPGGIQKFSTLFWTLSHLSEEIRSSQK